jgi:hypothetical protein
MKDEISAHTSILQMKMSIYQNFILVKNKSMIPKKLKKCKNEGGSFIMYCFENEFDSKFKFILTKLASTSFYFHRNLYQMYSKTGN